MPRFSDGAYDGETVSLSNDHVRLDVHRRPTGWGWGELFALDGDDETLVAVLEHLGEADLGGFPHRLRLDADDYERDGDELAFEVAVQAVSEGDEYMADEPPLTGTVSLSLRDDEPLVDLEYSVTTQANVELRYLRGPWLRVGADSFGADREDAIFPGVDWVSGDERSSGTDWFEHPDARRVTPHPYKVSIPVMAASGGGYGVGLSWTPESVELSPMAHVRCPQPVFASPNFIDRRDDSVLGVMLPSAAWDLDENELRADPPIEVGGGSTFSLDGTVSVVEGTSLDVVSEYVERTGLPEPREPRYDYEEVVDWIAECYDTNLWHEGEGFGADVGAVNVSPSVPGFVSRYVEEGDDEDLAESLREKAEWVEQQTADADDGDDGDGDTDDENLYARPLSAALGADEDALEDIAETMLDLRTEDGAYVYDPEDRHADWREEWSSYWRPLGQPGDSQIGFCAPAAAALLVAGRETGTDEYVEAAIETLEYARQFDKPAGDDWWETPIHGPNLFAAGKAAIAYELAYEETGDESYREDAVYWLRSLLPFTHLWQPHDVRTLYNTKPCLVSTAWYLSNWTDQFVQWEVLTVFNMSDGLGIDWTEVDPDVDWDLFHRGVTVAAFDWMIDSRDDDLLYEFQFDRDRLRAGELDGLYADVFHPVDEYYAGGPITPDAIGNNVLDLLAEDE